MFKFLSGDFVADYNQAINALNQEQKELDGKYSRIIDSIVERETNRLEEVLPANFKIGEKVKTTSGVYGVVIATPVCLDVHEDENYHGIKFGPGKYFSIKNESDEEVITCEGLLRMVDVEIEGNELEKDWMVDKKIVRYYADELTSIAD